jgi:C1A family cysteine protease
VSDVESEQQRGLGWIPDLPDYRDHDVPLRLSRRAPDSVRLDLEPWMPPVYDQYQLGSCTANALAAVVEYDLRRKDRPDFMPSRLFIYYNERKLEHTIEYDAGAMIRDGAKSLHKIGVCTETMWPYDVDKFAEKPPNDAYEEAALTKAVTYQRVARRDVKLMLAAGAPIAFGFTVYSNFWSTGRNGFMPLPDGDVEGGHAVVLCGYDTIDRAGTGDPFPGGLHYRVRNSWGVNVEDVGYFWMPSEFVHDTRLSSDFWSVAI